MGTMFIHLRLPLDLPHVRKQLHVPAAIARSCPCGHAILLWDCPNKPFLLVTAGLIQTFNLTEFRMTMESRLQMCLGGIFLIRLSEVGDPQIKKKNN